MRNRLSEEDNACARTDSPRPRWPPAGLAAAGAARHRQRPVLAYTNGPVMIYAGPRPATCRGPAGPGTAVTVMGCVSGYSWCDIGVSSLRGWVYGGSLTYPYQAAACRCWAMAP